jgi:peptidase E
MLVDEWGSTGLPRVACLFAAAAEERQCSGELWPGTLSWDDGDLIKLILCLFAELGLPMPKLSKQAWDMLWVQHEHDARNFADMLHAIEFCKTFCQKLCALAMQPDRNHIEVAPNLFLHADGVANPHWHSNYSAEQIHVITDAVDKWDSLNLTRTVSEIIGESSRGILEWQGSEVQDFVRKVYHAHQLPAPYLTTSQWHSLIRRFQRTCSAGLTRSECVELVRFLHSEIQRGDADLHDIIGCVSSGTAMGHHASEAENESRFAVRLQAAANDWRQLPQARILRGAKLDLCGLSAKLETIFAEVDADRDGSLQWHGSEIRTFALQLLQKQGIPVPEVPDVVWYQWFRELDHNNNGLMELSEAIEFAKHILERILQFRGVTPASAQPVSEVTRRRRTDSTPIGNAARNAVGAPGFGSAANLVATPSMPVTVKLCVSKDFTLPRRMLLTSSGLTRPCFKQALATMLAERKPNGNVKVLYIPDAAVGNGCDAAAAHCGAANQLMMLGVASVECAELRRTPREHLERLLVDVDCIYVEMGNTYYLRYYMRASGFDKLITPLVLQRGVVYVGASAGSMSAGRSIDVAFWKGWDDPGYEQEWDLRRFGYDGLNLLPGGQSVFPHYGTQWRNLVDARRRELGHEVLLLDEEHAHLIKGDRIEVIPSTFPRMGG